MLLSQYTVQLTSGRELNVSSPRRPERDPATGALRIFGDGQVVAQLPAEGWLTVAGRGVRATKVVRRGTKRSRAVGLAPFSIETENGSKFAPSLLGEYLSVESPLARDGSNGLWNYVGGVYQRGGEAWARERIVELLGTDWKRHYANEAISWLEQQAPRLQVDDPDPDRINVLNGILEWTGDGWTLKKHDPEWRFPVQLPVKYDPSAKCPRIERFLSQVLPDDEVRRAVIEMIGYLLVPDNSFQLAFLFEGGGGNGKSTLISLISSLLGSPNTAGWSLHALTESRWATADLYGALANVAADISSDELAKPAVFKSITGGDLIPFERKFGTPFSFTTFARLLFSCNEFPASRDGSEGFFRKWYVVPFTQKFHESDARKLRILKELTSPREMSGLLNLALAGLTDLRARGKFLQPEVVRSTHARFRSQADSVAGWWEEDGNEFHGWWYRPDVYDAYRTWCSKVGRSPMAAARFYERLVANGWAAKRKRAGRDGLAFGEQERRG